MVCATSIIFDHVVHPIDFYLFSYEMLLYWKIEELLDK